MRKLAFLPQEEQYAPLFVDTMEELIEIIKNFELRIDN
jgi:hypothetical protein